MEDQKKNSITSILEEYSIEERKNLIIDRTNGKIIDLRKENFDVLPEKMENSKTLEISNCWDDHWQESEKIHQRLLMAICQKNTQELLDLLNKKINHIPINVNYKSFDNWTPLHFASLHGNC